MKIAGLVAGLALVATSWRSTSASFLRSSPADEDTVFFGATIDVKHLTGADNLDDDGTVTDALVDAYNKVHDGDAKIEDLYVESKIDIPEGEGTGISRSERQYFTEGKGTSLVVLYWPALILQQSADALLVIILIIISVPPTTALKKMKRKEARKKRKGRLPPAAMTLAEMADNEPTLHQKFEAMFCDELRESGKVAFQAVADCKVTFTYSPDAALASKDKALEWGRRKNQADSGERIGVQMVVKHVYRTGGRGTSYNPSIVGKYLADAYNEVHADTGLTISNYVPDRVIYVPEENEYDEDQYDGDGEYYDDDAGDDAPNQDEAANLDGNLQSWRRRSRGGSRRRNTYGRIYNSAHVDGRCRFCPNDDSLMVGATMVDEMNRIMNERASAFESLVTQKLKTSGLAEYMQVQGVSIRFSYDEDDGPFVSFAATE